ncbi:SsrA-binding protein SmpB [bacterium]|nr:SsrA-binding protein SmpB [bacterium]
MSKESKPTNRYISHGQVSENRKARFEYDVLETIEAGMVLTGSEVKSLRRGQCNIQESYAGEFKGELWLFNSTIAEWEGGNRYNHEPKRNRKLLVSKKQLNKLQGFSNTKGMTLVPLKIYFNDKGLAKCLLGVAKGKQLHEKRDSIKDREWKRDQQRIMKDKW